MDHKTHGNHFENELEYENVTENLANLLKTLIVIRFIVSIAVVSHCKSERVHEYNKNYRILEQIAVHNAHNSLSNCHRVFE